jgi:hypothetical protein
VAKAAPRFDILPPNNGDHHKWFGERIERKTIDLGRGQFLDAFAGCTLVDCEFRVWRAPRGVSLRGSTLRQCTFATRREMRNLRFTSVTLDRCTFVGKYIGSRFGKDRDEDTADIRGCDFSGASMFHLCDFLPGADLDSLRWPCWPHVVVTGLPVSGGAWKSLKLPEEFRIIQQVIGNERSPWSAVTISYRR